MLHAKMYQVISGKVIGDDDKLGHWFEYSSWENTILCGFRCGTIWM